MERSERPDRNLALELVRVTEAAALAAGRWVGRGDKIAADQAAVDAMRLMIDTVSMDGVVVIGEGEKDEAPMLYNHEAVDLLRRVWGHPDRVRWIPRWVAIAGGALVEAGARIVRKRPPVCREVVRTLMHGHRYDGSKAERELGLRYTPIEESLRRMLSWYAEHDLAPPPRRPGT